MQRLKQEAQVPYFINISKRRGDAVSATIKIWQLTRKELVVPLLIWASTHLQPPEDGQVLGMLRCKGVIKYVYIHQCAAE